MSLANDVVDVLEPYIGRMAADTCVRATALSLAKSADSLGAEDMPHLAANIRRLLSPVAPAAVISQIVGQLERRATDVA